MRTGRNTFCTTSLVRLLQVGIMYSAHHTYIIYKYLVLFNEHFDSSSFPKDSKIID